jgi:hypothetical protein
VDQRPAAVEHGGGGTHLSEVERIRRSHHMVRDG